MQGILEDDADQKVKRLKRRGGGGNGISAADGRRKPERSAVYICVELVRGDV